MSRYGLEQLKYLKYVDGPGKTGRTAQSCAAGIISDIGNLATDQWPRIKCSLFRVRHHPSWPRCALICVLAKSA